MASRLQQAQVAADGRAPTVAAPSPRVPGQARFWGFESPDAHDDTHDGASLPVRSWLQTLRSEGWVERAEGGATGEEAEGEDAALVGAAADLILESRMAAHLERIAEIMEGGGSLVAKELAKKRAEAKAVAASRDEEV